MFSKNNIVYTILFFIALSFAVGIILKNLPAQNEYHTGADEGTYYRQAQIVKQNGISGFKLLADEYIVTPQQQVFPPPHRVAHILFASLALRFSDSYKSLSILSIIFFVLHCIVCFVFIKKQFNNLTALIAASLICFSPLSMGLAERALSDSGYYLFVSTSLFLFIEFIQNQSFKNTLLFILFYSIAILIKESALFLLPFFVVIVARQKLFINKEILLNKAATILVAPLIVILFIYMSVLGDSVFQIFEITNTINRDSPHPYIVQFNSGPWYQYFVDYFILSPITSVLFFLYIGYVLLNKEKANQAIIILFLFFGCFIIVFSFLPMNVRYAQSLDFIYRLGAALAAVMIIERLRQKEIIKKAVTAILILLLITIDIKAFQKFFVKNKIYDPISYNLLEADNFFNLNPIETKTTASNENKYQEAEKYLSISLEFYSKGEYDKCIEASKKALEINPNYVEAYNNICSAYNQLHQWDKAIEAGQKALEINPNNALAKNNLNWALSQKEK